MKNEELYNKIKELVPDIMELKMGCVVKYKGITGQVYNNNTGWYHYDGGKVGFQIDDLDDAEILGRPITLLDILIAIEKTKEEYWNIDTQGKIWSKYEDSVCFWNLEKNLAEQEQEVKDFLSKLLVKE